jgi:hypothetical protein
LEARGWESVLGSLASDLGESPRGSLGRGNDRGTQRLSGLLVIVIEEDGRERSTHVPLDVVGEQAQEDVGANAVNGHREPRFSDQPVNL